VLVAPLYVVSEFGLRQPFGVLIRASDFGSVPVKIYDFFTSADHKIGIFPSFYLDFGTLPSVGFFFFWNDAGAPENDIRVHFGTWGPEWINAKVLDRYWFEHDRAWVGLEAVFVRRADLSFFGEGPESLAENESRYESTRAEAAALLFKRFFRSSNIHTRAGVRQVSFDSGTCCGDPSIEQRVLRGDYPQPDGYPEDYTVGFERLELNFDTRKPRPAPGSGARLEARAEPAFQPRERSPRGWIRYGGALGGALDLTGAQRTLSLTLTTAFAEPLAGDVVPFNEQIVLGGGLTSIGSLMGPQLRGFRHGRLTGQSAAVAELQYTWPIWVFLDGIAAFEVGNVFGSQLSGFDPELLRMSAVFGMRTNRERDQMFELLVGFGTRTFADGAGPESFRLAFGTQRGF
jgi:hypothetical protein